MDSNEFEKNVLMELKALRDRLERLTDIAEQNQRYLEEILASEGSKVPFGWQPGFMNPNKEGYS